MSASQARPAPRGRPGKGPPSLWPKEHGAYAEVAFPLLTALALGHPTAVASLLVVATVASFLLHESVLVLFGLRGRRVLEILGDKARVQAAWLGAVVVSSAAGAIWLASATTRLAMLAPALLALVLIPVVATKNEKTTPGEVLVAAAFSSALIPVAIACGVATPSAVVAATAWAATFVVGTAAVRLTLERARRERGPMRVASPAISILTLAVGVAGYWWWSVATLSVVPTALIALGIWLRPVSAKRLRTVGWALVATNVFVFVFLVASLR